MLYSPQKKVMEFFKNKSKLFNIIFQHHKQATPACDTNGSRAIHKFTFGNSSHLDILEWSTFLLKRGFLKFKQEIKKVKLYEIIIFESIFLIYRLVCCLAVFWMVLKPPLRFLVVNAAGHLRDIQVLHPTGMNAAVESLQSSSELLRCQNKRIRESFKVNRFHGQSK